MSCEFRLLVWAYGETEGFLLALLQSSFFYPEVILEFQLCFNILFQEEIPEIPKGPCCHKMGD